MSGLAKALQIAQAAHRTQKDKNGAPHLWHVLRVVGSVWKEDAMIVAALHDVVEDSDAWPLDSLSAEGFAPHIVEAVGLLTRCPTDSYAEYIQRIYDSRNPLAIAVKIADLKDHLRDDLPRPAEYPSLKPRYERALETLTA